jgi:hypothetical protein
MQYVEFVTLRLSVDSYETISQLKHCLVQVMREATRVVIESMTLHAPIAAVQEQAKP